MTPSSLKEIMQSTPFPQKQPGIRAWCLGVLQIAVGTFISGFALIVLLMGMISSD